MAINIHVTTTAILLCVFNTNSQHDASIQVTSSKIGWNLEVRNISDNSSQNIAVNLLCNKTVTSNITNFAIKENVNCTRNDQGSINCTRNVQELNNCTKNNEGLTMTVLNQWNGKIIFYKVFKLWKFWVQWDNLLRHLSFIPAGRIIIMAFSGQGSAGLRYSIPKLTSLGSNFAQYLFPNSSWIWVFVKSGKTLHESCPTNGHPTINASLPLSLLTEKIMYANWKIENLCQHNTLLGDLCENVAYNISEIRKPPFDVTFDNLKEIPIIITAGSRIGYFNYMIKVLLKTPGIIRENIVVLIGGFKSLFIDLVNILDIKYKVIEMVKDKGNAKLFQYYRSVYDYVNKTFPNSKAAIFLDEDVEVSPDFFFYFNQTIPLLEEDETLYCINAFSTARSNKLVPDPTKIVRGIAQVAWGYAVTHSFIKAALKKWPTDSTIVTLFDLFLMMLVSDGRECVFPDQTRTLHFGSDGMNSNETYEFEKFNLLLPLVKTYGYKLSNICDLKLKSWKEYLYNDIKKGIILRGNPCAPNFIPKNANGTFVVYYLYAGLKDQMHYINYLLFGSCLGYWSHSLQGYHDGIATIRPMKNMVLHLVAVPLSNLSSLLPAREPVSDMLSFTMDERIKSIEILNVEENIEFEKIFRNNKFINAYFFIREK